MEKFADKAGEVADKAGEVVGKHPKLVIALCGALIALEAYRLFEMGRIVARVVADAHRAEMAADAAWFASEALGG